ncbi:hypothetical protein BDZ91DRAFT_758108 [Kalaharituber pfeilii]|nr:hypothetical protein BDZ91DRAFT_758108 [Kalaharituber pfeilii]
MDDTAVVTAMDRTRRNAPQLPARYKGRSKSPASITAVQGHGSTEGMTTTGGNGELEEQQLQASTTWTLATAEDSVISTAAASPAEVIVTYTPPSRAPSISSTFSVKRKLVGSGSSSSGEFGQERSATLSSILQSATTEEGRYRLLEAEGPHNQVESAISRSSQIHSRALSTSSSEHSPSQSHSQPHSRPQSLVFFGNTNPLVSTTNSSHRSSLPIGPVLPNLSSGSIPPSPKVLPLSTVTPSTPPAGPSRPPTETNATSSPRPLVPIYAHNHSIYYPPSPQSKAQTLPAQARSLGQVSEPSAVPTSIPVIDIAADTTRPTARQVRSHSYGHFELAEEKKEQHQRASSGSFLPFGTGAGQVAGSASGSTVGKARSPGHSRGNSEQISSGSGPGEDESSTEKAMRRISSFFGLRSIAGNEDSDKSAHKILRKQKSVAALGKEEGNGHAEPKNGGDSPATGVILDRHRDSPEGTRTGTPGTMEDTPVALGLHQVVGRVNFKKKHRISMWGGKKKTHSDDASSTKAWKLEAQPSGVWSSYEEYDLGPLQSGEPVPDLWDPCGDTLVYLYPPPVPFAPEPEASFRLSSSPLLFAVMGAYIQDVSGSPSGAGGAGYGTGFQSIQEESEGQQQQLTPNDLFLNLPATAHVGESIGPTGDWGKLDQVISGDKSGRSQSSASADGDGHPAALGEDGIPSRSDSQNQRLPQLPLILTSTSTRGIRYKLYYPRVAQQENSSTNTGSKITRLLDARNLFAFLDKKPLVASFERINAFKILEKLYIQLFIEPAVSSSGMTETTTGSLSSGGGISPPGTSGAETKLRRGYATPPRTPLLVASPVRLNAATIDDLPTKIILAESHLEHYLDELRLDDVRHLPVEPDSTRGLQSNQRGPRNRGGFRDSLEAMYLGEKWRSPRLFLEGYLHTVGRWESEYKAQKHPLIEHLSPMTVAKLDRAALDLENRERGIMERFAGPAGDFAYPAIFSGVGKYPQYKPWRTGFSEARKLLLAHLKWVYGSWPPRAGKKGKGGGYGGKHGGLNREVLKRVEMDVGVLWDLMVDWNAPRYPPGGFQIGVEDEVEEVEEGKAEVDVEGNNELRNLLEEYDRASPPVQPRPMFDMPRLPTLPRADSRPAADKMKSNKPPKSKKLKGDAAGAAVQASWNTLPTIPPDTAANLLEEFKRMEIGQASGKTLEELQGLRRGRWIFVYAVLQSLPMLVVDAPIARWTEGVEYFLSMGWKGSTLPWEDRDRGGAHKGISQGGVLGRELGMGSGMEGNRRSSVIWASAPGTASVGSPVTPVLFHSQYRNSTVMGSEAILREAAGVASAAAAGWAVPESVDDDEVEAAYHRSYCWMRAVAWCIEWEGKQRQAREQEMMRILEQGRLEWEEEQRDRREEFASVRMVGIEQQYHVYPQNVYGYGVQYRGTPSEGSTNGHENVSPIHYPASPNKSGSSAGSRTPSRASGSGQSYDIPEVLLPSTREKRMSTLGSGKNLGWGTAGVRGSSSPSSG